MKINSSLFALALGLSLMTQAEAGDALPKSVTLALQKANIPTSSVAVVVQEAGSRQASLQLNANEPMNPASVMKLVTTYAGLENLGPTYTWHTIAYSSSPVVDGVLNGDLYLKGSGDPRLTFEQFWLLLRQIRAQGIREIRGNLVLDRSAFNVPANGNTLITAPSNFDDQPLRPYNVKPDALLLNWKSIRIQLSIADNKLRIQTEPQPANLYLISQVNLVDGDCGDWKERLRTDVSERQDRFHLVITGNYPRSCGDQAWNLGVLEHPQYVFGVFRQLWEELGGSISGGVREGVIPANARELGNIESAPLSEIIRDINKFSNNVMARQLYLALGNGNPANSATTVRTWLNKKSLNLPELVLENGSGLSRNERISAASLAALLNSAWKGPLMPEMMASLPILGIDGTLKKRLRDGNATGQGHLKTGTLEGVKTIAGYMRDKQGKWQIVVFLINHPQAAAGQAAQDALLQWVAENK
ncbi:MAG TPA: D-alanyl-D-alanine carboxypeptidase/D-alanyl-D-alanine-endopeptidase [Rhodocyclaceae bacterium]|jgi:D-alanyl-D-alanine carboxypeptidase/D-alanyl-D-alanine-endopeptidase (penicillin-binding protein 4)|nr:D-alanyl-D-alanine carboxypeptidase/D-alanyl-D-alanine-endopeptidase [Rhodocyclaceae bacterium]